MTDGLVGWLTPDVHTPAPPRTQAELWFGAHPHGPSPLRDGGTLGGADLLVKILAAAEGLSLQVHPDEATAADPPACLRGPDGQSRLADGRGKEEILIALTPVRALAGFAPAARSAHLLGAVLTHAGAPGTIVEALAAGEVTSALAGLLDLPEAACAAAIAALPTGCAAARLAPAHVTDLMVLRERHPHDPGVLIASMLEHVTLQPWQAIHISPGTLHAYLFGCGVEVMTPSDNVIRLGLTTKAIDHAAGLALTRLQPAVLTDPRPGAGAHRQEHAPPGASFTVASLRGDSPLPGSDRYRIALVVAGSLSDAASGLTATKGEAVVLAGVPTTLAVTGVTVLAEA